MMGGIWRRMWHMEKDGESNVLDTVKDVKRDVDINDRDMEKDGEMSKRFSMREVGLLQFTAHIGTTIPCRPRPTAPRDGARFCILEACQGYGEEFGGDELNILIFTKELDYIVNRYVEVCYQ